MTASPRAGREGAMDAIVLALGIVIALAGGIVLGYVARGVWTGQAVKHARAHPRDHPPPRPTPRDRGPAPSREELSRAKQEQIAALERVSQMSREEAKAQLLEAVRAEAENDAVRIARAIERKARDEAEGKARDVVVTAIQRVMADHTAEMTVTVVPLPSDEMKGRIIGREGRNIRALEQAPRVDLIIDDTP